MLRRLLENWLDSASERAYQPAFCQMLSAKGHTIIHSTRHSQLEFGKDVLTIGPDGTPCAYQLKGNPGSRLTLQQFTEIQAQIVQLVTQPIVFPGLSIRPHNTYLVTNGIVEEEVQKAVDELNRGFLAAKTLGKPIEILARGHLVKWANDLGSSLWPSELEDVNHLLQLLVTKGDEIFPAQLLNDLLIPLLRLGDGDQRNPLSGNELRRRITSAGILTAVSLVNFSHKQNYWAIISAWIMYSAYVIGACEKFQKSYSRNAKTSIEIALDVIFLSLSQLCDELQNRKHLIEGNPLVDSFTYEGRYTLLVALMAIYWFWSEERGWSNKSHREFIETFVPRDHTKLSLWGEGVLPQLLIHLWYLRATDSSIMPDHLIAALLSQIIRLSIDDKSNGLASPYYTFEDVNRHILRDFLILKEDPFQGDNFRNSSFFALSLMHLLVRTNLKQTCKSIWPNFSRLNFKYFSPSKNWMFCLKEAPDGREVFEQPKLTKEWDELINEAGDFSGTGIPLALKENRYLFFLFVLLFPYRATPSAVRCLGRQFNDTWFIKDSVGT